MGLLARFRKPEPTPPPVDPAGALHLHFVATDHRASVDPDYSPGNKLISGLRDSAVSWAIILPLYYYCEKGAAVAAG